MTKDQCAIAVPLLNSYAHQYLGLSPADVAVAGGCKDGQWVLMVVNRTGGRVADHFDEAKALIDAEAGR